MGKTAFDLECIIAERRLKRFQAILLSGDIGVKRWIGIAQSSFRACSAVHEPHHAIAIFLWGQPGMRHAMAAWDEGGLTGDFCSLEEAVDQYNAITEKRGDSVRISDIASVFTLGGYPDPTPALETALLRLFMLPRYRKTAFELGQLLFEKGFVSHEEAYSVISASFCRAPGLV